MQIFNEIPARQRLSILDEIPLCIEYKAGSPSRAIFKDGDKEQIACLGCSTPKCMLFDDREIECHCLGEFSNDKNLHSCPVDAIKWDDTADIPCIDSNKCISCGVCIRRCPVGALYFDGTVKVNITNPARQKDYIFDEAKSNQFNNQMKDLADISKKGTIIDESDVLFSSIYEKLQDIKSAYHNLIGRNLLITVGCNCSMRRIGDVYTRMDAVYMSTGGSFGAVEVEFGRDTISASRCILEDIAVLNSRHNIDKHQNIALVICRQLPNSRQGYWQIIRDIKIIQGIKISTVTIGALMLLAWNGCTFTPEHDYYYFDFDNMSIRNAISKQINRQIEISNKFLGILEPIK